MLESSKHVVYQCLEGEPTSTPAGIFHTSRTCDRNIGLNKFRYICHLFDIEAPFAVCYNVHTARGYQCPPASDHKRSADAGYPNRSGNR